MSTIRAITDSDALVIEQVVKRVRDEVVGSRARHDPQESSQSPEVYVVLVPAGGIAARSGTAVSTARCAVYQRVAGVLVSAFPEADVYNLALTAVPASAVVPVLRDKFGTWWAVGTASSTAAGGGFTGCKSVLNSCTGAVESWHYVSGALMTIDFVPCPDCPPIGTGTGTGTYTGCLCNATCLQVTFPGLLNASGNPGLCSCPSVGVVQLLLVGLETCHWRGAYPSMCSGGIFGPAANLVVDLQLVSGVWVLKTNIPSTATFLSEYTAPNRGWTCTTPLVLSRARPTTSGNDSEQACSNWPTTATVELCGSNTGTGTGTHHDGSGGITIIGLGKDQSTVSVSSFTMTVGVPQDGLLVVDASTWIAAVAINGCTVTVDGAAMTNQGGANNHVPGGVDCVMTQFSRPVSAGVRTIVVTTIAPAAKVQMVVRLVTGLTSNVLDSGQCMATGTFDWPDTSTSSGSSTTSRGASLAAAFMYNPTVGPDYVWTGTPVYTSGNQDVIGAFGLDTVVLTEGRLISAASQQFRAKLENSSVETTLWGAYEIPYK